jgi:hypothetical protein
LPNSKLPILDGQANRARELLEQKEITSNEWKNVKLPHESFEEKSDI